MPRRAPCGSWASPITAETLTADQISVSEPRFDSGVICWLELRPSEGGRSVLMCQDAGGVATEVLPADCNVRTRLHEYGGGSWVRREGVTFFSDFISQRLFRMDAGQEPRPLTPEPPGPASIRYADADVSPDGEWLVCVREQHSPDRTVTNDIVILPTDGSADPRGLISGHDFFSFPRISPDGRRLLWTSWDHPRMPWDGTDLWVAEFGPDQTTGPPQHIAGGESESVSQPQWRGSEEICFISDRTGWGNLYAHFISEAGEARPLLPMAAEFGYPQWVCGLSRYALLEGGRLVVAYTRNGRDQAAILESDSGRSEIWDVGYSSIASVTSDGGEQVALVGGSPSRAMELASGCAGSSLSVLRKTLEMPPAPDYISLPEHIEFQTTAGRSAYAFFYKPTNPEFEPTPGEAPPLVVTSHGGPTGAATSVLNLATQFWTSRGFGVVDVNYRGSTGYGRAYMESLRGEWGEADVDDCVAAAAHLGDRGEVDSRKVIIRGRSASGLTTLSALVFHDVFRAGASYYGVADLESLARDTHKFESHYLDSLIGPYPERAEVYRSRSPLVHAEKLRTPVIFFQGLEDVVVPPSQAEALIRVLDDRGLPYAYLTFEGESHGFRRAGTLRRSLEAEFYFYARILGFEPADAIEPVTIAHLS